MTEEQAIAFDLLIANLEAVRDDLEGLGIVAPRKVERGGWEMAPVSEKQVEAIKEAKKHTRHCDPEYRPALKLLAKVPYAMSRGQAGMLLDVLYGSVRWGRGEADRRGLEGNERYNVHWKRTAGLTAPVGPNALAEIGRVKRVADVG